MLLLQLDARRGEPIYRSILGQVRAKIESGLLRPGERLPSTRRLADQLGIHRSTVSLAYQELWSLGFVDLRPGARPTVRERIPVVSGRPAPASLVDWAAAASPASNAAVRDFLRVYPPRRADGDPALIDFGSLDMDRRLFPLRSFRAALNRVIRDSGPSLLGYGDRAGYLPLREAIAGRLFNHGITARREEILITNGSQQALDLVFRMIAAPGRTVAVESPTYGHVIPLIRFCGLKPVAIPILRDGMDLDVLSAVLRGKKPALVYTMPTFQNPTGVSTGQAHRERLLSLCEAARVPLLEDGYDEEMKYFGRTVLPIKSMDRKGLVIYCGTFSKVLFPGVRIGWVCAARGGIERLTAIRSFSELSPSPIVQAAIEEFCRIGAYDRHIARMHRVFRKRMAAALRALRLLIRPEWAEWSGPAGGYLIWLTLKPGPPAVLGWNEALAPFGVRVFPGHLFYPSPSRQSHMRLSISTLDEAEIETGIERLARAFRGIYAGKTSGGASRPSET